MDERGTKKAAGEALQHPSNTSTNRGSQCGRIQGFIRFSPVIFDEVTYKGLGSSYESRPHLDS